MIKRSIVFTLALSLSPVATNAALPSTINLNSSQDAAAAIATVLTLRKVIFQKKESSSNCTDSLNFVSLHAHGILKAITEEDNLPMYLTRTLALTEKMLINTEEIGTQKALATVKKFKDVRDFLGYGLFGGTKEAITTAGNHLIKKHCSQKQLRRLLRIGSTALGSFLAERIYHYASKGPVQKSVRSYIKNSIQDDIKKGHWPTQKYGNPTKENIEKLLKSNEYTKGIKDLVDKQWTPRANQIHTNVIQEVALSAFYEIAAEIITRYYIDDEQILPKAAKTA